MVSLMSLWGPLLLSAIAVFVISAIVHMVLPYHRSDLSPLPDEEAAMAALRAQGLSAGDYMFPHAAAPSAMKDPAYLEKRQRGPVGSLTIFPPGGPSMGKLLAQWFVYVLLVSLFTAYVTGRALPPGAETSAVVRFAGVSSFLGYGVALIQMSIWWGRRWSTTAKDLFDALLYAGATAAIFALCWPR